MSGIPSNPGPSNPGVKYTLAPDEKLGSKSVPPEDSLTPTKYTLDKKPTTTPKAPATSYDACELPPSRPAITQARGANMGYSQRADFWRLIAVTKDYSEVVKFKAEAIKELQFSRFQATNQYKPTHKKYDQRQAEIETRNQVPITDKQVEDAINMVISAITKDQTLGEVYDQLIAINANLPDFIALALKGQFSRGPGNIETALTSFSDLDPNKQWADLGGLDLSAYWFGKIPVGIKSATITKSGRFELHEIIDILQSSRFYNKKEMVVEDNGTATLYKESIDSTGNIKPIALTKSTVDTKAHSVSFTLEDNSVEAVVALADQISTHRQGNSNVIQLDEMGDDPVLFAMLVHLLIRQHNMQVHMSDDLIREVTSALATLPARNQDVEALWQADVSNRLAYSKLTPKLLNADLPRTQRLKDLQSANPVHMDLFAKTAPRLAPAPSTGKPLAGTEPGAAVTASIGRPALKS